MRYPALTATAALVLLAACDGGGGGTGSDNLQPGEVAGVYNLCTLRFDPANAALPEADLLQSVVDSTPPAGRPEATVSLSTNGTYDLVYTRQSDAFLQQLRGTISYGRTTLTLSVPQGNGIAAELLLPRPMTLTFTDGPTRALTGQTAFPYSVARQDYARAAGVSETDLSSSISGSQVMTLSSGPC